MKIKTVAILMATFNGHRYIAEQIDSILKQSYEQWHLYIHDDGSTDGTAAVLSLYADQYPERITLLSYPSQGGAFGNFMSMLQLVEADYYMFCDQDDLWHTDKVELTMQQMAAAEQKYPSKPIVVHTDLRVVDHHATEIAPSFWQAAGMHPEMFKTFGQRVANVVTGCTMLFNNATRKAALSCHPQGHPLHDEWVTIRCCAEEGMVVPLFQQTIDYRQHGDNTLGADACYYRKTTAYYLSHLRRIWTENRHNYQVLRSAGYGSPMKYLFYKIRHTLVYHLKY